jgi:outer membrane lipoprotein SlyB
MHTRTWLLGLAFAVAGCATMGGYRPTVDPYNDPYAARIPQDEAECRELALHASGGTAGQTAIGGAVGGLFGAATGAAIGAATGSPGTGAAIGAASGGLGGGAYEGLSAEEKFKRTFQNCMRERGHHVLD